MELMEKMREHVDHMGVEVEEVFEVTGLELGEDEKAVHGDGIVYKAPAIILATGRKPIALDVPTECDQMHFCAICDGAPYKGKRVLVVGGGNSAFDEGLYLLNLGVAELTVVEIMDRFFAAEATQDALLGDPRVKGFKTTKVVDVEVTDGKLSAAILENAQTGERTALPVDGIFVFLGQSPNNEWFKDAIALDDKGYILRKVGEAYMVMPTGPRMKEYRGMITLNETGAFLFKESQKPEPTRDKLIQAAMEEYKVGEEEAAENVDSFIQQCADCHLFSQYDINLVIYNDAPEEEQEPEA